MEKILSLIESTIETQCFISATWSNPRTKQDNYEKCTLKPLEIKGVYTLQFTLYKDNKAYHHNLSPTELHSFILTQIGRAHV